MNLNKAKLDNEPPSHSVVAYIGLPSLPKLVINVHDYFCFNKTARACSDPRSVERRLAEDVKTASGNWKQPFLLKIISERSERDTLSRSSMKNVMREKRDAYIHIYIYIYATSRHF